MSHISGHAMSDSMKQCIENCTECHNSCVATLAHCLKMSGKHVEAPHLMALLDCAHSCRASADFMLRGSELHAKVCDVCAEACERCAKSCAQLGDDVEMKACADTCWRCAESCKQMANMKM